MLIKTDANEKIIESGCTW